MSDVTVRVKDNGPLLVEGSFTLLDGEGNPLPLDAKKPGFAFCRCGESARKPFCDGAHTRCDFSAISRAAEA